MVRTVNKITAILNIYCEHVNDRHIYMHKVSPLFDKVYFQGVSWSLRTQTVFPTCYFHTSRYHSALFKNI